MIYKDFQATSHGDQKFNIPKFDGEHNSDAFMDWLLQVEAMFNYKQFRNPKQHLMAIKNSTFQSLIVNIKVMFS